MLLCHTVDLCAWGDYVLNALMVTGPCAQVLVVGDVADSKVTVSSPASHRAACTLIVRSGSVWGTESAGRCRVEQWGRIVH